MRSLYPEAHQTSSNVYITVTKFGGNKKFSEKNINYIKLEVYWKIITNTNNTSQNNSLGTLSNLFFSISDISFFAPYHGFINSGRSACCFYHIIWVNLILQVLPKLLNILWLSCFRFSIQLFHGSTIGARLWLYCCFCFFQKISTYFSCMFGIVILLEWLTDNASL